MPIFDVGDRVKVSGAFVDEDGTAADPTTIVCIVKTPSGTETTYTYGTDVELVKDSTGNYHVKVTITETGLWKFRFNGTGALIASDDGEFTVEPQLF